MLYFLNIEFEVFSVYIICLQEKNYFFNMIFETF
jgi:hypothetical protein